MSYYRINLYFNLIHFFEPKKYKSKIKPGKRGKIKEFSKQSKLRLFYLLNSIDFTKFKTKFFVTLTFHEDPPQNQYLLKYYLKKFIIYLKRETKNFEYIWKLEFQKRKIEHYHIAIFYYEQLNNQTMIKFSKIVNEIWINITNCKCQYCQLYKTKTFSLTSTKEFYLYLTKEISKNKQTSINFSGRYWGHSRGIKPELIYYEEMNKEEFEIFKELLLHSDKINDFQKKLISGEIGNYETKKLILNYLEAFNIINQKDLLLLNSNKNKEK